ncbi:Uncharacterised protein [Vibrio cholerae]|nr:Uncharacterised protein [Vibrio cholerae]
MFNQFDVNARRSRDANKRILYAQLLKQLAEEFLIISAKKARDCHLCAKFTEYFGNVYPFARGMQ